MELEVGQVWEVRWIEGGEAMPSKAVVQRRRQGILTGIDFNGSIPTKLYFSCPMIEGRRNGEIQAREWTKVNATLIGTLKMDPPPAA